MFTSLLNVFFPKTCVGCSVLLKTNEKILCTTCRHEIPTTQHLLQRENEALQKFYGRIEVVYAASLFYFHKKGIVQNMIHQLKYKGREDIGLELAHWFKKELLYSSCFQTIDAVVEVPLHPRKQKERGYNQVSLFAKTISQILQKDYCPQLLVRTRYSNTQTKKTIWARNEMNKAVFVAQLDKQYYGKHILLVDDILTTGATLEACCRALLEIPDVKISILTMAIAE
ncbi:ComF family protein [Flavobacterium croceum]|uniref:ComF family protein n=1 Tax=Flavobacterium croceum TaxID=370975 RepID=UPI0024A7AAA6|nr:phosphoribosyltransferase family protein [Flavobacterium croceum]